MATNNQIRTLIDTAFDAVKAAVDASSGEVDDDFAVIPVATSGRFYEMRNAFGDGREALRWLESMKRRIAPAD